MRSRIKNLVLSGWVLFGLVGSSWVLSSAHASVTCANPNQTPPYNVSSSSANNVPVNQCYLNTVGECLYNTAIPGSAPSWNTGCPANIAGNDCCRWKGAASASPTPRPTETPRPSPFPSGACCKAKPNANPGYNCSLPLLNFGHPQGISFAYQRCVQVNGGASCMWSNQNKECCAPGIPGCSSPTPSPTPACSPPQVGIPFPFSALATQPELAEEYANCKKAAGSNSAYVCCVDPVLSCKRKGGVMINGSTCPRPMSPIFGPVQGKICCKSR